MTAESENWTTAQLWVFLGSYMTSMRCLHYGHEETRNYLDKKSTFQTTISFTRVLDFAF